MPEGPECRTIADELINIIEGKIVQEVVFDENAKQTGLNLIPKNILVKSVGAHGKKLIFELDSGTIVTSLGMNSRWSLSPGKHTHVTLAFNNFNLYYDNVRFGHLDYYHGPKKTYLLGLGPDVLADVIEEEEWREIFRKTRRQVAVVLLDQSKIAGIGNYLRNEIIFAAKINPTRQSNTLDDEELERLREASHLVIRESYKYGGLTIESFWSPSGKRGVYPTKVYGRDKDPDGNKVVRLAEKGKQTIWWVPAVQH